MNSFKSFKLVFIVFFFLLKADDNFDQHDTIVISLGRACGVAGALREYNLRTQAYPFDWIVSPFDALYEMIETDFDNFLPVDHLIIRSDGSGIVDTINKFEFVHDFPTTCSINQTEDDEIQAGQINSTFLNHLPYIKEKYNRRISRFINACTSNKKVIFIRNRDIGMQEAIDLCRLLTRKYPQLDYVLVLIDDENKMSYEMNVFHPLIKNFYESPYIDYNNKNSTIVMDPIFWTKSRA